MVGVLIKKNYSSAKDEVRRWSSDVLQLRAKVADLQLRQRPERAGRPAEEGERGSIRASLRRIERAGISRTVVGVCKCVGIRLQYARGRSGRARAGEGASRKSTSVKANSGRRRVDGLGGGSSWDSLSVQCGVAVVLLRLFVRL